MIIDDYESLLMATNIK